jgi:HlyD family secretion protein
VTEQALKRADDRLQIPELARKARLRRLLALLVVGAAGVAGYFVYARKEPPLLERYRTDSVARRTIVQLVETTGSLDVRTRVEVPAPIPGRLISIAVRERDQVKAGQVLATLDERAAELALRSAKVTVEAASGRVAQAQAAHEAARQAQARATQLASKGLASQHDVQAAKVEIETAKAALDAARAERRLASESVAAAQLGKSLGTIVAPAAGVVLQAPDRLGAAVSPERGPLFLIGESLDVMRIEALVSETEIALIAQGAKADVMLQALPGKQFSATVERIGIEPRRDGGVVLYAVTLSVENPDHVLLPGMTARVRMEVARAENTLAVHEAALRFTPEDAEPSAPRSRVWRKGVGPNDLEPVAVTLGISDGVYTEVKGGLDVGDELAIGLARPTDGVKKPKVSLGGGKR